MLGSSPAKVLQEQNLGGSSAYAGTCDVNPDNPDNFNPIAKIKVIVYNINLGGQPQTAITVGSTVVLDATPVDASNKGTNSQNDPVWNCSGPYELNRSTCFQPRGKVTATGSIVCSISLDGIASSITFGVGVTPTSGSQPPGDPAEDDTLCAYRDSQGKYHCIIGTQNDLKCNAPSTIERCGLTPCERKSLDKCVGGGPAVTNPVLTPKANSSDLGQLINFVFSWSLRVIGIVVFVMILYNGFRLLMAGGDPNKVTETRSKIINALLGAALLLAAYLILSVINPNLVKQTSTLPALPGSSNKAP